MKEYLKMADVTFGEPVTESNGCIFGRDFAAGFHLKSTKHPAKAAHYVSHAINSHDELVHQRDHILDAMRQTLAMLRTTSHGPSAANKAEDMLHAAICGLDSDHSPDAAPKMNEESVNDRLGKALDMIMAASQALMSKEFEFHGKEVSGPKLGGE